LLDHEVDLNTESVSRNFRVFELFRGRAEKIELNFIKIAWRINTLSKVSNYPFVLFYFPIRRAMKICVLGAGIAGITSAYFLSKSGHEATIVDTQSRPGAGASYANGAQLSYSYVAPLADPAVWADLPKYLLSRDSPLQWRPQFDVAQWRWILRFLQACTASASREATVELLRLAFYSRDALEALQSDLHLDFEFRNAGKLVMMDSARALVSAQRQVDFQASLGCQQQVFTTAQCIGVEPALSHSATRWAGGVYTPGEQVGDCASFCTQLADTMRKLYPATRFLFDTAITGAVVERGKMVACRSTQGDIQADAYVLAMGSSSAIFADQLRLYLPVYPLNGYSVTLEASADAPQVSITDLPRKIVYARIGNRVRVAGRIEIVGHNRSIDEQKCAALVKNAQELFPGLKAGRDVNQWVGSRPATPTGIPIIGRSPVDNLYINTGHGALGWTLACGSARIFASQIDGEPPDIADAAFRCAA
jgi:D-amino-acid dehydrogenase